MRQLLGAAREAGITVIHTREGHRPDMTDAPRAKVERGAPAMRIGDRGPMGRILIRGEAGHDIIPELYPLAGEPVLDKPGKGAFYQTDLDLMLRNRSVETLLVCGVTTEVCVHTTVREANDRGLSLRRRRRLLRLLFPGVPRGGPAHDRRPGRHLRLGDGLPRRRRGAYALNPNHADFGAVRDPIRTKSLCVADQQHPSAGRSLADAGDALLG